MTLQSTSTRAKLFFLLAFTSCSIPLCGQVRGNTMGVGGPAHQGSLNASEPVSRPASDAGVAATQLIFIDTLVQSSSIDSLELVLLHFEIAKASEQVRETSFWRRIIPQIHLSASFGMHDLIFIDPGSFTPYILPRDAYRLTISLPLNEAINSSRHTEATLELDRLKAELSLRTTQRQQARRSLERQLQALQAESASLERDMSLIQELLHFNELRFQQGKIEFDALTRTKLELTSAMRTIMHIHQQEALIQLKLNYGNSQ